MDEIIFNDSFKIDLYPGTKIVFENDRKYARKFIKLFQSYTTDELHHAQLYLHI